MNPCPFCAIVRDEPGSTPVIERWPDAVLFEPLAPVTPGHLLVVPTEHVADFTTAPVLTAQVMARAGYVAASIRDRSGCDMNLITSAGPAATQTVQHLHVHLVPRVEGDGLHLPWTNQHH